VSSQSQARSGCTGGSPSFERRRRTSPLCAFREAVSAAAGPDAVPTAAVVYGVLSLIL